MTSDAATSTGLPIVSNLLLSAAVTSTDANNYASAISIVIGALFLGAVQVIAAKATARAAVKKELEPVAAKLDAIAPVVDKINTHVNSEKDRALGELAARDLQIELQRETIDEMRKAAGLLAQAKAMADASISIAQAASSPSKGQPVESKQDLKETVKEAVVESVKPPVKEALKETFTPEQVKQIVEALKDTAS